MCGIYGIIGLKDKKLLQTMGACIKHRGPDDQGEYIEGNIGLGYRRLAIIDTKGSFQPLFNENKNLILFFNGEIYNYKELRSNLKNHKFQTNPKKTKTSKTSREVFGF
jgi:asparagine synthase (glutamine-hydrolysing)